MKSITLHNITMIDLGEVAEGLRLGCDTEGHLRLHDGEKYRGYVNSWGRNRFRVDVWSGDLKRRFSRVTYKTQAGAEHQLIKRGIELNTEA